MPGLQQLNCDGCNGADAFAAALEDVCRQLAHLVVRDGEGALRVTRLGAEV